MSPDVQYDPELAAQVATSLRESLDYDTRLGRRSKATRTAEHLLIDLLPPPWPLAAALRDVPADVRERLPEGTIARLLELLPESLGSEAREVLQVFQRSEP